jgi:FMN phosphatase YigB (HAD superfamily)
MAPLLLCDLGGVVVRIAPERCHRCWSTLSPLPGREVSARLYPDELYEALERGEISGQRYIEHVREQLQTDAADDVLLACFNDIYLGLDEDVLGLLAKQRHAGSRLVALTNTNQLHHDRWWSMYREQLGLFDHIYLSFELGSRKPEPACFHAVLEAEGVAPGEVVFIDDVEPHVEAARVLGLRGIHFASARQLSDDLHRLPSEPDARRS